MYGVMKIKTLFLYLSLYCAAVLRVHSHLKFIRRDLLPELFSPYNRKMGAHPLLNFSVQANIDQTVSVNVPT